MNRYLAMMTASVAVLGAPAAPAYADSVATYRGVAVSAGDVTVTPEKCSTTTRVAVYYTDPDRQGPPPGSRIGVSNSKTGAAVEVVGRVVGWRNGVSSVTYSLRLCGLDTRYRATDAGWYRVAVPSGPGGRLEAKAGFTVRYQGLVSFNASPEPVRRGSQVTLTASVSDGWEFFDTHPIRLYFRSKGSTGWRYLGSATPRCDHPCGDGEVSYTAVRRFRQTVSGTWKAVSPRTSYLESGSRSDAVDVT